MEGGRRERGEGVERMCLALWSLLSIRHADFFLMFCWLSIVEIYPAICGNMARSFFCPFA
jgi:hypothetical protein